jgi:hypothetical protein
VALPDKYQQRNGVEPLSIYGHRRRVRKRGGGEPFTLPLFFVKVAA